MTKEQLWAAHVAKNPAWANGDTKIQLTVDSLKKLLMNAHDLGYKHCADNVSMFTDIFSKRK